MLLMRRRKDGGIFRLLLAVAVVSLAQHAQVQHVAADEKSTNDSDGQRPLLRWASTGGGWRSQFACVGFANLFAQSGLFAQDGGEQSSSSSAFSAISTTSGASWFSTQLFYSNQFYRRVVHARDGQELYDFVVQWMDAYLEATLKVIRDAREISNITPDFVERTCNVTGLGGGEYIELLADFCSIVVYLDGDWALFVDKMIAAAAESYGDDELRTKLASSDNRIEPLRQTDLLVQSALAPNTRIRSKAPGNGETTADTSEDAIVYVGPSNRNSEDNRIYSAPISAVYVVNATGTNYHYSTQLMNDELVVHNSKTPSQHSFADWEDFHLYPAPNGTLEIDGAKVLGDDTGDSNAGDRFSPAFGGGDSTVIQVAAISSAAAGTFSPLVSSVFTHGLSAQRHAIVSEEGGIGRLKTFERAVARLYRLPILDKIAVCSKWPNKCGERDGIFVDGYVADNPALANNIGQNHRSGGDLGRKMKVILTNTNQEWGTAFQYTQILQYFESPINKDVKAGEFIWPSGMWTPYQSPQLFQEAMNSSTLDELLEGIEGSNMTTAILNGTTIDNPSFGVKAGQHVEILLINVNEPITTYVVTPTIIRQFTEPLANMTKSIAENEELRRRVEAFLGPPLLEEEVDHTFPTSSGATKEGTGKLLSAFVLPLTLTLGRFVGQ